MVNEISESAAVFQELLQETFLLKLLHSIYLLFQFHKAFLFC